MAFRRQFSKTAIIRLLITDYLETPLPPKQVSLTSLIPKIRLKGKHGQPVKDAKKEYFRM